MLKKGQVYALEDPTLSPYICGKFIGYRGNGNLLEFEVVTLNRDKQLCIKSVLYSKHEAKEVIINGDT